MKLTLFTVLSAVLAKSASSLDWYGNAPDVCNSNLEVDFSSFPDGYLAVDALTSYGIPEICCIISGNQSHQCLIKDGRLVTPVDECFEISVTFADALYTAGFELTAYFDKAPLENPISGMPAIDGLVADGSGGLKDLYPNYEMVNLPGSYPGRAQTVVREHDFAAAAIYMGHPMAIEKFSYLCHMAGGGSDPHFMRWRAKKRDSFQGECDLVFLSSEEFHEGSGFDVHVRTTIKEYYSYIEAAAVRLGDHILEIDSAEKIYLDGQEITIKGSEVIEIPNTNGDGYTYTYSAIERKTKKNIFRLFMGTSELRFKFYRHCKFNALALTIISKISAIIADTIALETVLTIDVMGGADDFGDSVGLMGNHSDGSMVSRSGKLFEGSFEEYGFEWQVNPAMGDKKLFIEDRSPQLPYERCRMPTASRPQRRHLRASNALYEQAKVACQAVASPQDVDLCIDDIMATGELGLAEVW